MSENAKILIEGSYLYFENEVNYSQENFKLVQLLDNQTYYIYAEITSRLETGEFLKILVRYEMNNHYIPTFMRIEKSLSNKFASETFKFDPTAQELKYTFQNSQSTQDFTRTLNAKHYLTSPAFSTSAIFTLSKRFDASSRIPIVLFGSSNDWTYESPPDEKVIYADFKRDIDDFVINNNSLPANKLCLFEHDANFSGHEDPVEVILSKHYAIPYQMTHMDRKIMIKNLKRNA